MKFFTATKQSVAAAVCLALSAALTVGAVIGRSATAASAERQLPIYAVETDEKKVAVTFDAAWSAQDTEELIAILKKHNAKATVFAVGDWAEKFPESVKAFHDAGHTIGNHSDTHKAFSKCSYKELREEMENCNKKLEKITGEKVTLVRAPSGDYTNASIEVARELNMTMIQWDTDSLDYRGLPASDIVKRILSGVGPGSIILFHNGVENTAEALDLTLTELGKQGYSFVSADELIYKDNYRLDHAGRQHKN